MYFASPIYIMKKEMNFTFAKIPNSNKNFKISICNKNHIKC